MPLDLATAILAGSVGAALYQASRRGEGPAVKTVGQHIFGGLGQVSKTPGVSRASILEPLMERLAAFRDVEKTFTGPYPIQREMYAAKDEAIRLLHEFAAEASGMGEIGIGGDLLGEVKAFARRDPVYAENLFKNIQTIDPHRISTWPVRPPQSLGIAPPGKLAIPLGELEAMAKGTPSPIGRQFLQRMTEWHGDKGKITDILKSTVDDLLASHSENAGILRSMAALFPDTTTAKDLVLLFNPAYAQGPVAVRGPVVLGGWGAEEMTVPLQTVRGTTILGRELPGEYHIDRVLMDVDLGTKTTQQEALLRLLHDARVKGLTKEQASFFLSENLDSILKLQGADRAKMYAAHDFVMGNNILLADAAVNWRAGYLGPVGQIPDLKGIKVLQQRMSHYSRFFPRWLWPEGLDREGIEFHIARKLGQEPGGISGILPMIENTEGLFLDPSAIGELSPHGFSGKTGTFARTGEFSVLRGQPGSIKEAPLVLASWGTTEEKWRQAADIAGDFPVLRNIRGETNILAQSILNKYGAAVTRTTTVHLGTMESPVMNDILSKMNQWLHGLAGAESVKGRIRPQWMQDFMGGFDPKGRFARYDLLATPEGQRVLDDFIAHGSLGNVQNILDQTRAGRTTLGFDVKDMAIKTMEARAGEDIRLSAIKVSAVSRGGYAAQFTHHIIEEPTTYGSIIGQRGRITTAFDEDIAKIVATQEIMGRLEGAGITPTEEALRAWALQNPADFKRITQRARGVQRVTFEAVKHPEFRGFVGLTYDLEETLSRFVGANPYQTRKASRILERYGWIRHPKTGRLVRPQQGFFDDWKAMSQFQKEAQDFLKNTSHGGALSMLRGGEGLFWDVGVFMPPSRQSGAGGTARVSMEMITGLQARFGNALTTKILGGGAKLAALQEAALIARMESIWNNPSLLPEGVFTIGLDRGENALSHKELAALLRGDNVYKAFSKKFQLAGIPRGGFALDIGGRKLWLANNILGPEGRYLGSYASGRERILKPIYQGLAGVAEELSRPGVSYDTQKSAQELMTGILNRATNEALYNPPIPFQGSLYAQFVSEAPIKALGETEVFRQFLQAALPNVSEADRLKAVGIIHPKRMEAMMYERARAMGATHREARSAYRAYEAKARQILSEGGNLGELAQAGIVVRHPALDPGIAANPLVLLDRKIADHMLKTQMLKDPENRLHWMRARAELKNAIKTGDISTADGLLKFMLADLDGDTGSILLVRKDAQQEVLEKVPDMLYRMGIYQAFPAHKTTQEQKSILRMIRQGMSEGEISADLAAHVQIGRTARATLPQLYDITRPAMVGLAAQTQTKTTMLATRMLNFLHEAGPMNPSKVVDPESLYKDLSNIIQMTRGRAGSSTTQANIFGAFQKYFGSYYEDAAAKGISKDQMDEAIRSISREMSEEASTTTKLYREALSLRGRATPADREVLLGKLVSGAGSDTNIGLLLQMVEEDFLPHVGEIRATQEKGARAISNLSDFVLSNRKALKTLGVGLGVALGASILLSPPKRLDLKEEELHAAAEEARRQGMTPAPSADFRAANPARFGVRSGWSAKVRGVANQTPDLGAALRSLNDSYYNTSANIRITDSRSDITARRAQRMAETGRSY
jgi:hypothetical protein